MTMAPGLHVPTASPLFEWRRPVAAVGPALVSPSFPQSRLYRGAGFLTCCVGNNVEGDRWKDPCLTTFLHCPALPPSLSWHLDVFSQSLRDTQIDVFFPCCRKTCFPEVLIQLGHFESILTNVYHWDVRSIAACLRHLQSPSPESHL